MTNSQNDALPLRSPTAGSGHRRRRQPDRQRDAGEEEIRRAVRIVDAGLDQPAPQLFEVLVVGRRIMLGRIVDEPLRGFECRNSAASARPPGRVVVDADGGGASAHRFAGAHAEHHREGQRAGGEKTSTLSISPGCRRTGYARRRLRAIASNLEIDHLEHHQVADRHPAARRRRAGFLVKCSLHTAA